MQRIFFVILAILIVSTAGVSSIDDSTAGTAWRNC